MISMIFMIFMIYDFHDFMSPSSSGGHPYCGRPLYGEVVPRGKNEKSDLTVPL